MFRPAKCKLRFMHIIPSEGWSGTRFSVFRRHRSSANRIRREPNILAPEGLININSSHDTSRNPYLENVQSNRNSKRHRTPQAQPFRPLQPRAVPHGSLGFTPTRDFPKISTAEVIPYFQNNVLDWATDHRTLTRIQSFGIILRDAQTLLRAFASDVEAGRLSDPKSYEYYSLQRFSHEHYKKSIGIIYSTIFFSWASQPSRRQNLEKLRVTPATIDLISRLVETTSRTYPADEFPEARTIHRKIILHVGPTNSGKTHHALRALAAANSGVYAGPLRLLAHEIWNRLNTGQIIPLGVEDTKVDLTVGDRAKYAIPCDMVTGEERKVVEGAKLLSCTVEMLSLFQRYDVAVVDEIQLINDPERGGSWTKAVLGLVAHEIHLCGEETAIPIVQNLLRHTGDEIIIKKYERLTPLVVEDESLGSNLKNIRKGDCIVTFSRSNIFKLKNEVERETGLKCAVVYGRLPPEVRNEQAALFNDPTSDYDVIIGSDAIGMGLNLKIKRVIFEAMSKFSFGRDAPLSISTVKQIAGRAGRYGLHKDEVDLGGTVTTLHPPDLSVLKHTLSLPYNPLPFARLDVNHTTLDKTISILPPKSSLELALTAPVYIGSLPPFIRHVELHNMEEPFKFIDKNWAHMGTSEKLVAMYAPIPWKDQATADIIKRLLTIQAKTSSVGLADIDTGLCHTFKKTMENVETAMKNLTTADNKPKKSVASPENLKSLESFHKVLVFYIWMAFRNPVVYSDCTLIVDLKARLEVVLNWILCNLPKDAHTHSPSPKYNGVSTKPQTSALAEN